MDDDEGGSGSLDGTSSRGGDHENPVIKKTDVVGPLGGRGAGALAAAGHVGVRRKGQQQPRSAKPGLDGHQHGGGHSSETQ
eukprot:12759143-Alexandrium_andersonii.AAC.1